MSANWSKRSMRKSRRRTDGKDDTHATTNHQDVALQIGRQQISVQPENQRKNRIDKQNPVGRSRVQEQIVDKVQRRKRGDQKHAGAVQSVTNSAPTGMVGPGAEEMNQIAACRKNKVERQRPAGTTGLKRTTHPIPHAKDNDDACTSGFEFLARPRGVTGARTSTILGRSLLRIQSLHAQ